MGVIPIYESASGFSFNAEGEIAEYSVKMRELPHGCFLSELLATGSVGEKEINRVISCLHRFYESETPTPEIEQWGTPEKLKISTNENFAQVRPFVGRTISPAAFETIRYFTDGFYAAREKLFRDRIRQHRIRDCHGDLHLDHIHITPEATTIFDCIEFNDRFRFIDIANDLAFLAMDFDFQGRSDLANLLLETAARDFRDPEMLNVSDFYKCYRAFVRGKVDTIQASDETADVDLASVRQDTHPYIKTRPEAACKGGLSSAAIEEHAKHAARYFRLALRYAVSGSKPLVLVVMGRVASGKTTVARQLGSELDWPVFSSDQIRKTLAGIPLTERTGRERRGEVYSEQMTKQTYRQLVTHGLNAVESHGGIVLDATFSSRALREFLYKECENAHVGFQLIELDVDLGEIERRLMARNESTGEISDARLEDLDKLNAAYGAPSEFAPDLIKISTNDVVLDTVRAVLRKLAEKQLS